MTNVVEFPSGRVRPIGQIARATERQPYHIHIEPGEDGFDWWLCSDDPNIDASPDEDDVAADLAAIALSLRPPKRSFFERLRDLFLGDQE